MSLVICKRAATAKGLRARRARALLVLGLLAATAAPQALATEDGTLHYPVGVNTIGVGYMPVPGTLDYRNYSVVQWANTLADNEGDEELPGYSLNAEVNAARFLYTFKTPVGPFNYSIGLVFNIIRLDLDLGFASDDTFNLGDLDFENYLSFHSADKKFFGYFGLDIYAPTGRYDTDHIANVGKNYWSFDPSVDATYHLTPQITLNGAVYVELNTRNSDTDYRSGDSVDLDYGVSFRPFADRPADSRIQHVSVGVVGYYLQQFTDDEIGDESVEPDGHRARTFAIGPQVAYHTRFGGLALKWEHDLAVRNRAAGDAVWFQFALPIAGTATHMNPLD